MGIVIIGKSTAESPGGSRSAFPIVPEDLVAVPGTVRSEEAPPSETLAGLEAPKAEANKQTSTPPGGDGSQGKDQNPVASPTEPNAPASQDPSKAEDPSKSPAAAKKPSANK